MNPVVFTVPFRLGFVERIRACLRIALFGRVDMQVQIERADDGSLAFKEGVIHFGGVPGGVPETDQLALPAQATP